MTPKKLCGDEWLSLLETEQNARPVTYIQAGDEVLIVPLLDDGRVILTVEPSVALGKPVLILPGGAVDEGELALDSANRELQEEIGYKASQLDLLAHVRPWSKYLTVSSHLYLARGLTPATLQGDEDYEIATELTALDGFETLLADGTLTDARVITALFLARRFLAMETHLLP